MKKKSADDPKRAAARLELIKLRSLNVRARAAIENLTADNARLCRELDDERARRSRAEGSATLERVEVLSGALRVLLGWITEDHKALANHPMVKAAYEKLQPWTMAQLEGEVPPPAKRPVADLDEHLVAGGLSVRTQNVIDHHGIYYVGQLLATTQEAVLRWMMCSRRTLDEIHRALRAAGYLGADEELPREQKRAKETT